MRRTLLAARLAIKAPSLHRHLYGGIRDDFSSALPAQGRASAARGALEYAGCRPSARSEGRQQP
eukprot:8721364-Heterocapsa_arctica.AAC.1